MKTIFNTLKYLLAGLYAWAFTIGKNPGELEFTF